MSGRAHSLNNESVYGEVSLVGVRAVYEWLGPLTSNESVYGEV